MSNVKDIDPVEETWHGSFHAAYNATRGNTYEDTATLRLSGRMVPGHTPSAHRDEQGLPQAAEQATT